MQDYEIRFNESNNALKDIQNELECIMRQNSNKDKIV